MSLLVKDSGFREEKISLESYRKECPLEFTVFKPGELRVAERSRVCLELGLLQKKIDGGH